MGSMEKDHLKSDKVLSREAIWLSIFGVGAALGFIGGLISRDWFLASLGLVMGIMCLVPTRPGPQRGVSRSSRTLGRGCGGRGSVGATRDAGRDQQSCQKPFGGGHERFQVAR
jgi:hypothetical protein